MTQPRKPDAGREATWTAVALLYDAHADAIARYLHRRLGPEHVEDAVASVFERAWRSYDSYVPQYETALPWLYGIATNVVADNRRAERRRLRALARLVASADPALGDPSDDVSAGVDPQLLTILRRLTDGDRETLLLVAWGELTYEETAAALGIPVGTVRSRLARARRQLGPLVPVPPRSSRPATTHTATCS